MNSTHVPASLLLPGMQAGARGWEAHEGGRGAGKGRTCQAGTAMRNLPSRPRAEQKGQDPGATAEMESVGLLADWLVSTVGSRDQPWGVGPRPKKTVVVSSSQQRTQQLRPRGPGGCSEGGARRGRGVSVRGSATVCGHCLTAQASAFPRPLPWGCFLRNHVHLT